MTSALIPQIVMFLYFQAVEWLPVFPWNDIASGNTQQPLDVALGAIQLALIVWTSRGSRLSFRVAQVLYSLWLGLQVLNWWIPYFFGVSDAFHESYTRLFGRTHKFLPAISNHPIPDSNHVVLQILLSWVLMAIWVALGGITRKHKQG